MRPLLAAFALVSLGAMVGCGEAPPRPNLEDTTRRVAPIPACIMYLPPTKNTKQGFVRQLTEEQYWQLVFPGFDDKDMQLAAGANDCTGRPVLNDWRFKDGQPIHAAGWPEKVEEGDIVFGAGGDRLKVIWLRSHRYADGTFGGALAMVRTQDVYAEVYGVGVLRGDPTRMRLQIERMGPEAIVTATEEGCLNAPTNVGCETHVQVFLPRKGQLRELADIPLERRAFAMASEPGYKGRIEYRLTTAPDFKPDQIKLFEQVMVHDDRGRELRKAELQRIYVLTSDGDLHASEGPLWPRVYNYAKAVP